ncbi:MAG TPA: LLM class flavin-dependent oxidoreductase [Longimicrobiaceae bacterium]|nr:LLM class flavin-dependent oxidoreductase [Longimicrobiaceae bacterium]
MIDFPLSILDLALVGPEETIAESYAGSIAMARLAEEAGYLRVWYAEHHGMTSIASAATAVLIAHVAAHTTSIRLGAGGVMLPNHSPLVIAEQYGTLAELHPGRIDLGLGRAPGGDSKTFYALRRDPSASDHFPRDVVELRGLLSDESPIPGLRAIPGHGTHVPLYILGSSLFGAQLAAMLGLPYAFASHFAPQSLHDAIRIYRERFEPSEQLDRPYVMASVNVIAADDDAKARAQMRTIRRERIRNEPGRAEGRLSDEEVDAILGSPHGGYIDHMLTYSAIGTPGAVVAYLEDFRRQTGVDELITVHRALSVRERLRSVELLAEAGLAGHVAGS